MKNIAPSQKRGKREGGDAGKQHEDGSREEGGGEKAKCATAAALQGRWAVGKTPTDKHGEEKR